MTQAAVTYLPTNDTMLLLARFVVEYTMAAYSSYTPTSEMVCPGGTTSPLEPGVNSTTLRQINYIINTFYNIDAGINGPYVT
jgi:hypothetical protein